MADYAKMGLLAGVGEGISKTGEMFLSDALMSHRDSRLAMLKGKESQKARDFTAEENRLDRASREGIAAAKESGGGKGTKQKDFEHLVEIGTPEDVARDLAYNGFREIRDENTGSIQLISASRGAPVGQLVPQDPGAFDSPMVWEKLGEGEQGAGLTWDQAETQAKKEYDEKASVLRSDKSQFGKSEEEWIRGRAEELYKGGDGLVDGPSSGKKDYSHLWKRD